MISENYNNILKAWNENVSNSDIISIRRYNYKNIQVM